MNGFYWLASYPKSGNTWLRLFIESLSKGGKSVDINSLGTDLRAGALRLDFDRTLDIESSDLTDDEVADARPRQYELEAIEATTPLLRKVHDAWKPTPAGKPLFPPTVTLGAVYVVRDPRDVAVSYTHHMGRSTDQAIEDMANSMNTLARSRERLLIHLPQRLNSWSEHVESWLSAPIKLQLIKYEDMLAKPVDTFSEVAHFLGFDTSPDKIAQAVEAVRFDKLQSAEDENGFMDRLPGQERFFRKGVAGGWRDSLSIAQMKRIESEHGSMMKKLGYL